MEKYFSNAMRQRRRERGLTLEGLAERSGVSRAALSKIERTERTPSLANALLIAEALRVPLAELVGQRVEPVSVTRAADIQRLRQDDSGALREAIIQPYPGTEVVRYTVPPGANAGPFPAHETGTREGFLVLSGEIEVHAGKHIVRLTAGDAAALPVDQIHEIVNKGSEEAVYLLLIGRPI